MDKTTGLIPIKRSVKIQMKRGWKGLVVVLSAKGMLKYKHLHNKALPYGIIIKEGLPKNRNGYLTEESYGWKVFWIHNQAETDGLKLSDLNYGRYRQHRPKTKRLYVEDLVWETSERLRKEGILPPL